MIHRTVWKRRKPVVASARSRFSAVFAAFVVLGVSTCLAAQPNFDEVRATAKEKATDASNFQERFEALKAWVGVQKNKAKETGRPSLQFPSLARLSEKDDPVVAAKTIDYIFEVIEAMDRTETELFTLSVPEYEQVQTHVHRPKGEGPCPGVILVGGPGCEYALKLAAENFVVVHFNPATDIPEEYRRSWGGWNEGFGYTGQDVLYLLAKYFMEQKYVDKQNVGIATHSFGVVGATGALARHPDLKLKYLVDDEGPSGPSNIAHVSPDFPLVKQHPATDEAWWKERTAAEFIKKVRCRYLRLQAETDHNQGTSKAHAAEMLNNALAGGAPWTRCNDNPPNITYDSTHPEKYQWIPGKPTFTQKSAFVIRYIKELAAMPLLEAK